MHSNAWKGRWRFGTLGIANPVTRATVAVACHRWTATIAALLSPPFPHHHGHPPPQPTYWLETETTTHHAQLLVAPPLLVKDRAADIT
ncbi:hypothetical protein V501_09462 [Pseudogymnoascus sp. VKM F-4519 (FW-2642)]|nr:hypothetical protein V501_09462 [Pseudogymnoascus sp. VKM F-4519 (FW-2642)]